MTFLDYTRLEAIGENIEAKLSEKEKKSYSDMVIRSITSDQVMRLMVELGL